MRSLRDLDVVLASYAGVMAGTGGRGGNSGRSGRPRRSASPRAASSSGSRGKGRQSGRATPPARGGQPRSATARAFDAPADARAEPLTGPFRLGAIEGATPGKWISTWKTRIPSAPLELVPLTLGTQRAALIEASVDAALLREPFDHAGLHTIALYEEHPVVICARDSHLATADELTLADLEGEVVIAPQTPPLRVEVPGALAARFAPPADVAEAIAIAASGVGVVIVPMSLARLHHRKDVTHRPLIDGPVSPVVLAWREGATTPLIEAFIGIVRGRTANSSR